MLHFRKARFKISSPMSGYAEVEGYIDKTKLRGIYWDYEAGEYIVTHLKTGYRVPVLGTFDYLKEAEKFCNFSQSESWWIWEEDKFNTLSNSEKKEIRERLAIYFKWSKLKRKALQLKEESKIEDIRVNERGELSRTESNNKNKSYRVGDEMRVDFNDKSIVVGHLITLPKYDANCLSFSSQHRKAMVLSNRIDITEELLKRFPYNVVEVLKKKQFGGINDL